MQVLNQTEIDHLLAHQEFSSSVLLSGEKVAVVLTQDWCPQWKDMESYLPGFEDQVKVHYLEYNRHQDFERIMGFKEDVLGNDQVPYLRFYKNGKLIAETNWIPRGTFQALLKKEKPFALK